MVRRREQNGAEKRTNGVEKRTNGAEKRTNSAEKRTNGAEKRTNGAEKRPNRVEKRKCTLGPPYIATIVAQWLQRCSGDRGSMSSASRTKGNEV